MITTKLTGAKRNIRRSASKLIGSIVPVSHTWSKPGVCILQVRGEVWVYKTSNVSLSLSKLDGIRGSDITRISCFTSPNNFTLARNIQCVFNRRSVPGRRFEILNTSFAEVENIVKTNPYYRGA